MSQYLSLCLQLGYPGWPRPTQTIPTALCKGHGLAWKREEFWPLTNLLLPVFSMLLALLPHLIAMVTRQTHDLVKICSSVSVRPRSRGTRSIFKANIFEFMVKFNLLMYTVISWEILRVLFQTTAIKQVSHKVSHNIFFWWRVLPLVCKKKMQCLWSTIKWGTITRDVPVYFARDRNLSLLFPN